MKLLTTASVCKNIHHQAAFLRSKGIAVYLSDQGGASIKAGIEIGLWVIVESQYEDALLLLKNPNHQVRDPITDSQVNEIEALAKKQFAVSKEKFIERLLLGVTLIAICFFVIKIASAL
ncbi:MAG TPA: hypothetical protein VN030_10765 [Cellvibrio sp.]|nr:hypothetical protein [Cellvibrio sp.]